MGNTMRSRYPAILAILVILTVTAVAGCTSAKTSPTATVQPAATIRPTATIAPASATATASPAGSQSAPVTLFDPGRFTWYEYKITMVGTVIDLKTNISTAPFGGVSDARLLTSSKTTTIPGEDTTVSYSTLYYEPDSDRFLGGHVKAIMGSTVLYDKDIATGDPDYAKSDYAGQSMAGKPVYTGNQPIAVPKASYPTAAMYTMDQGDSAVTYWIAPGTPLPVQMTFVAPGGSSTMQLIDYG